MRILPLVLATTVALLAAVLPVPALAHGGAEVVVVYDCAADPCLRLADGQANMEPGAEVHITFSNHDDADQFLMVHLDEDGPGAMLGSATAPGQGSASIQFVMPTDGSSVWLMTSSEGSETARILVAPAAGHGDGTDMPAIGLGVLLGVLAFVVLVRRR